MPTEIMSVQAKRLACRGRTAHSPQPTMAAEPKKYPEPGVLAMPAESTTTTTYTALTSTSGSRVAGALRFNLRR